MKISINGYIIPNEYKEVYNWFGYDSCCPNDIKAAKAGAPGESLDVTIGTCYGGSIFAGSEIGAEIGSHQGGAFIEITGLAASAASVIAMYARSRMAPTAMLMVHNVSSVAEGDFHAMDKESDTLKQCNKSIAAAYVMKTGMSEEDALKLMDKESWLTAQKAKELGLVDEVMFASADPSQLVAAFGSGMLPKAVIEKTRQMLKDKKEGAPKDQVTPPAGPTDQDALAYDLAYAKLKLAVAML